MGLGPDSIQVEAWDVGKSKGKGRKKKDGAGEETGCWTKFRFMGSCFSSRSKVDNSISGTSTHYAESKSTNDTSRDQPVVPVVSSTTVSNTESNSSIPEVGEELKVASQLRKFTFNELKSATRNFRPESLLGEGGFGCVFKGWIEENGTAPVKPGTGLTVAVKTLNHDGLQGHKEWLAEVNFLGDLLHPNLVRLIGYCIEDDQRLLVYEFMPRGSLENHLFRKGSLPLPWSIRMKIALGAAKGLAFLHEEAERPVIYRDFKTSNILLDAVAYIMSRAREVEESLEVNPFKRALGSVLGVEIDMEERAQRDWLTFEEGNMVADWLANQGLNSPLGLTTLEEPLEGLKPLLRNDVIEVNKWVNGCRGLERKVIAFGEKGIVVRHWASLGAQNGESSIWGWFVETGKPSSLFARASPNTFGHLTSRSDVYSFGVVLLEMLTGRRSMDKNRPNGEHNLVEWARPHLGDRRRFYRLIDPRLEGHFSIKGGQKAVQLAAHCLSRDPKARPLMSEVVEALKPLLKLKDMASSSYYFQTMQADRAGSNPNSRNCIRTQASLSRNGQPTRSLSIPNGSHASPYHYHHHLHQSPKPNGKQP
ncbi:hypothetical protein HHK36_029736 [Tetracentron sinense]|uniref:non-specific serine/threonine protein kinase n=1 Tax=Tetracentron sinense TaxID=13715 RepID=A0A835CZL9_TETSI|nr:hypothetical protein HHK36_029736 [Tetracentron sinense]